jgi:hypothetical protein
VNLTCGVVLFGDVDIHRRTAGGATRQVLAGFVLLATSLVCLWIGTYEEFLPVGIRGVRYRPIWTVPVAVAVGIGGALLAFLFYRQSRRRLSP